MKDVFKFICAGLLGVLIGGIFLGFLGDLLFTNWVATGSVTFGNWAMWTGAFFTMIAALAAIYAAFGAVRTLNFLKEQDAAVRAHDQKRFEHDEAIWKEQRVMLKFQQFREHKADFDAMLTKLESAYSIQFVDRFSLYKMIFPSNSHADTSYRILVDEMPESSLLNFKVKMEAIIDRFHELSMSNGYDEDSCQMMAKVDSQLDMVRCLLNDIGINLELNHVYGDLYIADSQLRTNVAVLNIFDAFRTIDTLKCVVNSLLDFAHIKLISFDETCSTPGYQYAIVYYGLFSGETARYKMRPHPMSSRLESIFNYHSLILNSSYREHKSFSLFHDQFYEFIRNPMLRYLKNDTYQVCINILEKARISAYAFNNYTDNEFKDFVDKEEEFLGLIMFINDNEMIDTDFD